MDTGGTGPRPPHHPRRMCAHECWHACGPWESSTPHSRAGVQNTPTLIAPSYYAFISSYARNHDLILVAAAMWYSY